MTDNLEHGWIVDGIDNDDGPDIVHCCECCKELTDDELQRCVDNQKSDNGTYFYNGIQYEFDELFDLFKKKRD